MWLAHICLSELENTLCVITMVVHDPRRFSTSADF